ncbi:GNAT family N-acetyltransferase [Marinomonas sp. C2222]|uniref:GNAT family N-acetyltransferase n=1 Tax=Marinomonas sargassi TaxID=2984494 RepID=A0ABT2YU66_9GAMM|nr:GNAT family N-acetyltransferase [Marinomonas sargassi]MCV2403434.1 GNAT family N-acetyltransferase [Marinomonas sargassi]
MTIDEANIANLKGLWTKYGAVSLIEYRGLNIHHDWPHRCWFNRDSAPAENGMAWLDNISSHAILPIWPCEALEELEKKLVSLGYHCTLQQMAMYKDLREIELSDEQRANFEIVSVNTKVNLKEWCGIASDAFQYKVSLKAVETLLDDIDARILLGYQDNKAVACALLLKTGEYIGVHQMGVKQTYQGKGIAKYMMNQLIKESAGWGGRYLVLQASASGQPLYESLGFSSQFLIKSYMKNKAIPD